MATNRMAWRSESNLYSVIKFLDQLLAETSDKYIDKKLLQRTRDFAEHALQAVEQDIEGYYALQDAQKAAAEA